MGSRRIRRGRTFAGCWRCRERRVKCDEKHPGCSQCYRYGASCPGYNQRLAWVEHGDGIRKAQIHYEPQRRRKYNPGLTWGGEHPVYTPSQLDTMLSLLDLDPHADRIPEYLEVLSGPYSALKFRVSSKARILRPLSMEPDWDDGQSGLFYHYLISVAPLMMPLNLPQNPWNSTYPLLARNNNNPCQECLMFAILAQAAANLAHLGCRKDEMMMQAYRYHSKALRLLRTSLETGSPDFVSFLAATLTLIMAEAYLGMNNSWRIHLQAAWSVLVSKTDISNQSPWLESESAWIITQSLCLVKIRTECDSILPEIGLFAPCQATVSQGDLKIAALIRSVMMRQDFGFTAGLDRGIIDSLLKIQVFHKNPIITLDSKCVQDLIAYLRKRLRDVKMFLDRPKPRKLYQEYKDGQLAAHHSSVALNGTMIYLYRLIADSNPAEVKVFVTAVFESVETYRELGGRNLTVWPVFQAAVEACNDINQGRVKRWLADSIRLGIGNRRYLKQLVVDTWKRRNIAASVMGLRSEQTVVNWKMLMPELDVDILLI